jgi:sulfane dehydrogenase subunit SoxC
MADSAAPTRSLDNVSLPARLAEPDEGVTLEELQLAARNHGMPLEALRYDVTPVGLHYLLVHYDIPHVEPSTWRLRIGGAVGRPAEFTLDDLRALPATTARVTMECAGNGRALLSPRPVSQPWLVEAVGTAEWTGTPLAPLLRAAEPATDAVEVVFTGHDHGVERGVEQDYQRSLPLEEALLEDVLLVYAMNGQPLPVQHGAPVRLVAPGWYGMAQVKWLAGIEVVREPFTGFQQVAAYRFRQQPDEPGEPVTRMVPRALLVPPGFPDFQSRVRVVEAGECLLEGRAWSGHGPVTRVEVTVDGGGTWQPATLEEARHRHAWQRWHTTWQARPGRHVVGARAFDAAGQVQPTEAPWNRGGFANNLVQRVPVLVRAR